MTLPPPPPPTGYPPPPEASGIPQPCSQPIAGAGVLAPKAIPLQPGLTGDPTTLATRTRKPLSQNPNPSSGELTGVSV